MFRRALTLPKHPKESFFLWGRRQIGKSFWLKKMYPEAEIIDLLQTDQYLRYLQRPSLLREEYLGGAYKNTPLVVIDEIQKLPMLLDEVHWLIENQGAIFVLCGSSARKLRRGHANLLGGWALRYEMHGLVSKELGQEFDLGIALNHGNLPRHYLAKSLRRMMVSYIQDYLAEEVAAEGLVRNLPAFSDFLRTAALADTEMLQFTTVARDCGVSVPTAKEYYQILVDTMLGACLPAYTYRPKRRVIQTPKFYFANVGIVNELAHRGELRPKTEVYGKALENWMFHELRTYSEYKERFFDLAYFRLSTGTEVDFIVHDGGKIQAAIEVKAKASIQMADCKGLFELKKEHPDVPQLIMVSLEPKLRKTGEGVQIFPVEEFLKDLWQGSIV